MARLREFYEKEVIPALKKEFGFTNPMEVPRFEKIVVNMGVGEAVTNGKLVDAAMSDLGLITGQKPQAQPGAHLGGGVQAAREHADRMQGDAARRAHVRVLRPAREPVAAAHPRLSRRADARASTAAATTRSASRSTSSFPEIDYDKIAQVFGMDITIVTTARTDEQALALLTHMKMPFRKN